MRFDAPPGDRGRGGRKHSRTRDEGIGDVHGGLRVMVGLRGMGAMAAMVVDGRREGSLIVHHSRRKTRHGVGCSADRSRGCIHCIVKLDGRRSRKRRKRHERRSLSLSLFFSRSWLPHDVGLPVVNGRRTGTLQADQACFDGVPGMEGLFLHFRRARKHCARPLFFDLAPLGERWSVPERKGLAGSPFSLFPRDFGLGARQLCRTRPL